LFTYPYLKACNRAVRFVGTVKKWWYYPTSSKDGARRNSTET